MIRGQLSKNLKFCHRSVFLGTFILLTFLCSPAVSYGQLIDLSTVESLQNQVNESKTEDSDKDNKKDVGEPDKRVIFDPDQYKVEDYGYSGENSFNVPPKPKEIAPSIDYFGYSFFLGSTSSFAQEKNILPPSDYVIGPGDVIKIILFGTTNRQLSLKVNPEGEINFPEIGPIALSGMTFENMKSFLQSRVLSQFIGTKASVSLGSLRTINVFMLGEVMQPGMYSTSSLSTITNALIENGGVKSSGSLRNIQLKREGRIVATYDFYDLLLNGNLNSEQALKPNDVIFIPPKTKTAGITGQVLRSGIYELKPGENINDLIRFSGGFMPKANKSSVDIQRIDADLSGYILISANLANDEIGSEAINNGDLVTVYSVNDSMNNAILISGHAPSPGFHQWTEGMTFHSIFSSENDFLPNTDKNYVLHKTQDENGELVLSQFDFNQEKLSSKKTNPIILKNKDEIIFLPKLLSLENITSEPIPFAELSEEQKNYFLKDSETIITYDASGNIVQERITPLSRPDDLKEITQIVNDKFYRYKVYNYCELPTEIIGPIVDEGLTSSYGYESDLQDSLQDLMEYQRSYGNQKEVVLSDAKSRESTNDEILTDICRRQIIKKTLDLMRSQASPFNESESIEIKGNVFFPGQYPISKGMLISDAIKAAGGLRNDTFLEEVELIRTTFKNSKNEKTIQFFKIDNREINNQELQAGDIINIKQSLNTDRYSRVDGLVNFPGDFPITTKETLSQLYSRAGGSVQNADLDGAIFQRNKLRISQINQITQAKSEIKKSILLSSTNQGSTLGTGETVEFLKALEITLDSAIDDGTLGRVVINLPAILSGKEKDIELENGDILTIPFKKQTISVIGEVYAPTSHLYIEGLNVEDYISKSGGISDYGNRQDTYIVKNNGTVVTMDEYNQGFFRSNKNLQPGDTIVVPLRIEQYTRLNRTLAVTNIAYQIALAAAAVNSF